MENRFKVVILDYENENVSIFSIDKNIIIDMDEYELYEYINKEYSVYFNPSNCLLLYV